MKNLRDYILVTACYWVFTLTDGALRMLVLLHLHEQGHAPLEIASLFVLYELFGVVTNLFGGWIGARHGLRLTLIGGLALQVLACALLAAPAGPLSIPLVLAVQALSGVAKDLTKMSSKSYIKLVVAEGDAHGLLKWVALLTGSKNSLKGAGFFLGGFLLAAVGLRAACLGMGLALTLTLGAALWRLPRLAGKSRARVSLGDLWPRDARIQWLSVVRLWLFGARDVWFVLALPLFLSSELGWSHSSVGAFLALWIIGYGLVQAAAPALLRGRGTLLRGRGTLLRGRGTETMPRGQARDVPRQRSGALPGAGSLRGWTDALVLPLLALALALRAGLAPEASLILGLALFGLLFAACSSIHSYLIIAYAEGDKVALRVGFYYMANALGRLLGTVLSGFLYQAAGQGLDGLIACLWTSLGLVLLSRLACVPLRRAERALA